ncbi:hypothetical protein ICN48_06910 [Polynucleobacter sp. JS-Safj-400b-B2]|uniref:hypothetical protein n=1 Tax=Polynucleobacter sp. JS-Safj-400b-B2 TaxID=2576921 RepID=UPI001C0DE67B|nr:hypothetical protein [Polynucleobacter sp. JS-Safj-400b-B2]MBU3625963.1 hypothetical protein [Polynucleobacter sp. JS-Safj-400b-B2]
MKKILLVCLLSICSFAHAQYQVFDAAGWMQTNATAISTVRNELQTAQMVYTQAIQLQNQLRQGVVSAATQQLMMRDPALGSMLSSCVIMPAQSASYPQYNTGYAAYNAAGSASGCLGSISNGANSMAQVDAQMLTTLQNQQAYLTNVQANYGASGVSGQTYAQNLALSAAAGNAKAQDLIATNNSINAELAIVSAKRKSIAEQMPNVAGITDSINLTTTAVDNLTEVTMAMAVLLKKDIEMRAGEQSQSNSQYQQFLLDRANYNQKLVNGTGASTSSTTITAPF